jgi:hypothetical protein
MTNIPLSDYMSGSFVGYTGSQGNLGYTGSKGDIGYTGSQGYTGSKGDIGYTGSASTVIGYTGSKGDIGYTGSIPAALTATSLALGGATLGTHNLAVTGTTQLSSSLGIGTTPSTLLHLYSADPELRIQGSASSSVHYSNMTFLNASGTTLGSIGLSYYGGAAEFVYNSATSWAHVWKINNTEAARIDTSGNFLLATTLTPTSKLGVQGDAIFSNGGNVGDAGGAVNFSANGVDFAPMARIKGLLTNSQGGNEDQGGMAFYTRPYGVTTQTLTERLRITSAGLVGIGMTPTNVLDITQANAAAALASIKNTTAGTAAKVGFQALNDTGSYFNLLCYSSTFTTSGVQVAAGTGLIANGQLGLSSLSGPILFATNGTTEVARIGSDGNLAIGTTSSTYRLVVLKDSRAAGANYSTSAMQSSAIAWFYGGENDTSKASTILFNQFNSTAAISCGYTSTQAGFLAFGTSNGSSADVIERARIDSSGNFGIGTTSPGTYGKLAVNGAIAPIGTAGTYSIDVTAAAVSVANNGTVEFPSSSGMLVVNNHNNGGLTIYICGGGTTAAVASVIGAVGTFAYSAGNSGYTWTNNTGGTVTVGFFFVRTRTTA